MVTIVNFKTCKNSEGKEFIALLLQGDIEFIRSKITGKFYATAKKCIVNSTFDKATSERLIGKTLPGVVERIQTAPYVITNPKTGEKVTLDFTYVYNPAPSTVEEKVFEGSV